MTTTATGAREQRRDAGTSSGCGLLWKRKEDGEWCVGLFRSRTWSCCITLTHLVKTVNIYCHTCEFEGWLQPGWSWLSLAGWLGLRSTPHVFILGSRFKGQQPSEGSSSQGGGRSIGGVFISWGCHGKIPHTGCLKITEMDSFTVLKARSPKIKISVGPRSLWRL